MKIISSRYWNIVHGANPDDVRIVIYVLINKYTYSNAERVSNLKVRVFNHAPFVLTKKLIKLNLISIIVMI